jgi:hypothetical protein
LGGISGALTVGRALFLGEAAVDVDLRFGSCQRAHIEGRPLKNTLRFPVHFYFPQNRDEPTLYRSYSFVRSMCCLLSGRPSFGIQLLLHSVVLSVAVLPFSGSVLVAHAVRCSPSRIRLRCTLCFVLFRSLCTPHERHTLTLHTAQDAHSPRNARTPHTPHTTHTTLTPHTTRHSLLRIHKSGMVCSW